MSETILNSSLDRGPEFFYRRYLFQEMARRTERNPQYSLRAFARSLDTDAAALSRIMNGKKTMTFAMATRLVRALALSAEIAERFLGSVAKEHELRNINTDESDADFNESTTDTRELGEDLFSVISDWYHYALLELTFVKNFRSDIDWMARVVGIPVTECQQAVDRLLDIGLLKMISGRYRKISRPLTTKDKAKTSAAHRMHQQQMLEKSIASLQNDSIEIRSHTGMTIPISPEKLPEAKRMIQAFSTELCQFLAAGEKTSVYQLSISLFPLVKDNAYVSETHSDHRPVNALLCEHGDSLQ